MNVQACDLCYREDETLVAAETVPLQVEDRQGQLDLCPKHLRALYEVLAAFIDVSRMLVTGDARRCPECDFVSASKEASAKHRRRHQQARERAAAAAAQPQEPVAV